MSTNPLPQKPPVAPPATDQPGKRAAILIIGALVLVGMAYGSGLRTSTKRLAEAKQELLRVQTQADAARSDVARRDTTIRQLEARRQLHLALIALDERNFGTAQGNLNASAILLGNAGGDDEMAALTKQIRGTNLVAAADFSGERQQVLEFARRLDAAIPPDSLPGHGMNAAQGIGGAPAPR